MKNINISKKRIIARLSPLIWTKEPKEIDIDKDKNLIIHHVLSMGDLQDIGLLYEIYSKKQIIDEFLKPRKGLYPEPIFKFIKIFLGIDKKLDEADYVKSIY